MAMAIGPWALTALPLIVVVADREQEAGEKRMALRENPLDCSDATVALSIDSAPPENTPEAKGARELSWKVQSES